MAQVIKASSTWAFSILTAIKAAGLVLVNAGLVLVAIGKALAGLVIPANNDQA